MREDALIPSADARTLRSAGAYPLYVLGVLFVANAFCAIDRAVVGLLVEPIKADMGVSDTAMGLLTGFAFVAFYSLFGIPVARWADRGSRRTILSIGVFVWSGMTALCGAATNFATLALARVGVGIGEATCFPTALPLIADYFRRELRTKAIAVLQSALYVGIVVGTIVVGAVTQEHGWRAAFFVLGVPGLLLAIVIRLTVREPPRGAHEPGAPSASDPRFGRALRGVFATPAYRFLFLGMGAMAMVSAILAAWGPAYMMRLHGMSIAEVGRTLGPAVGFGGIAGALAGGVLATALARHSGDERWSALLPALAALAAVAPLLAFVFTDSIPTALAAAFVAALLNSIYMGPALAAALGLVPAGERGLATAAILIGQNVLGWGLGPLIVGVASDLLAARGAAEALRLALLAAPAAGLAAALALYLAYRRMPPAAPRPAQVAGSVPA